MMFSYDTIENYYKTTFALIQHHKYSLTEIENMIPWEKYVYLDLLKEFIERQEQERRDQEALLRAKNNKRR